MESSRMVVLLCTLAFFSEPTAGYPNGKVKEACSSMVPVHGHAPQKSPKHTIEVNVTQFKPGDHVKVTLSGPTFEGFFLQARDAENLDGAPIGSFVLADKRRSQLLTCGHVKNSAVSHTSKSKKTYMDTYWIAPRDAPKSIQFLVTVVEKYSIFWVKIPGPVISQPNVPILTTTMAANVTLPAPLTQLFNASECGTHKFCVRNPWSCDPKAKDCFFLSFRHDPPDSVLVEMSGPSEGYIAFALSDDQWMGDGDDAYLCISEDHHIDIKAASLVGRTYPEMNSGNALEEKTWRVADGLIQCSFRRKIKLHAFQGRVNLDASYYIFLADGETNEGGGIHKHTRQPLITNGKQNVTGPPKDIGGSRSPFLVKIHGKLNGLGQHPYKPFLPLSGWLLYEPFSEHTGPGIGQMPWKGGALMFVAWMTTVSIGVIVARFFKPVWPHVLLFGEEIWFQIHRGLMLVTVLLTSASFILPFLYRGGWSEEAGFHPYFGCTVMVLAIFQPLMAGFRPPPQAPRRIIFNWFHWSTGTMVRILAVITMFLGMDLPALNLPDPWDVYLMTGFVAWHVGTEVLLEIHGYCLIRKVEVLEDDRVQILQSINSAEAQGHTFKKAVLFIYILGNMAFLIVFLMGIVQI